MSTKFGVLRNKTFMNTEKRDPKKWLNNDGLALKSIVLGENSVSIIIPDLELWCCLILYKLWCYLYPPVHVCTQLYKIITNWTGNNRDHLKASSKLSGFYHYLTTISSVRSGHWNPVPSDGQTLINVFTEGLARVSSTVRDTLSNKTHFGVQSCDSCGRDRCFTDLDNDSDFTWDLKLPSWSGLKAFQLLLTTWHLFLFFS